jgi:RNA polymerase sigma-70 factor (ECF subfamily)
MTGVRGVTPGQWTPGLRDLAAPNAAPLTIAGDRPYCRDEDATEEDLMLAYAAGDEQAFRRLFAALAPSVHRFFLRSFRDRSMCDELLQTTFLRVHRGRASYQAGMPLRPWLFTIAAHVRRDELRRVFRLREDAGEEALAAAEEASARDGSDAERAVVEGDVAERVRAALDGLPESQRIVIQLHRFESMTFAEIASVLGTSEVAVRGRAFRAYAQLRKTLAPTLEGGAP